MKVQGRVKKLMDVRSGVSRVGNAWKAQDFIFEYFDSPEEQYADTMLLNVRGEKIEELSLHEGDEIEVELRCKVRSYGERLYNEPYARDVVVVKPIAQPQAPATDATSATTSANVQTTDEQKAAMERLKQMGEAAASGEGGNEDELPF